MPDNRTASSTTSEVPAAGTPEAIKRGCPCPPVIGFGSVAVAENAYASLAKSHEATNRRVDELVKDRDALERALRRYGGHLQGCTKRTEQLSEFACSCGFTEAVNGGR